MERWQGRVVLVTGASAGIGAAICRTLAQHGMKVVGCARNIKKIEEIASEFPDGTVLAVRCDLSKEEDILCMFEEIRSKYGRIDVCINNAAYSTASTLLTAKTEEWRGIFEVNVLALCICTREAVKLMQEKSIDDGQIIQISSIAGHKVFSEASYYSATKYMVQALTEGLRQELRSIKSHIRVAGISPGAVITEFANRMFPDDRAIIDEYRNSFVSLQSEDVAEAVVSILRMPEHVDINDILIRPVEQAE